MSDRLQEMIKYYEGLGNQAVSASLVVSGLTSLKSELKGTRICHRSMSGRELRDCIGKQCDRYQNCRIAWKRALLDQKTYDIKGEAE